MHALRYLTPAHLVRFLKAVREIGVVGATRRAWVVVARDRAAKGRITPALPVGPAAPPQPRTYLRAFWRGFPDADTIHVAVRAGFGGALPGAPAVSVIVPVYGHLVYTLRCLWSVLRAGDRAAVEVIVVDDGPGEETRVALGDLPGLVYLKNETNLGFLRACTRAAAAARAPVLYFLNNDTAVLPGWIDTSLATLETYPEAGLVGSKLIYPDGTLQEAGGCLWRGGGGANAGRRDDPAEPGWNWLRDVDYVSGAGIAVRRVAWDDAGGFDDRFAPAYCEDADLAMTLRQRGWRVLYQPGSEVVHFEGVSSGTSTAGGVKAHQVTNFARLAKKWAWTLERHAPAHIPDSRALPRARPRIALIDATLPTPDKDAGSVVATWYVTILQDLGYDVTYVAENLQLAGEYGRALQRRGVEVPHAPYVRSVEGWIREHGHAVDVWMVARVDAGGRFAASIRAHHPAAPVIFNTVDLHYLRFERQARLEGGDPETVARAAGVKSRELALIRACDATIVVSEYERAVLAGEGLTAKLAVIPLILEARPADAVPPRAGRSGIAFVGGYEHPPNVDAVLWFLREVWPLVHAEAPELTFHVAGSKAPPAITGIDAPGVVVEGYVADLDAFLDARAATVAPLRYGAGIKGKVGSSLAAGVPCIASPIAVEGMGLNAAAEVVVAEAPDDWARAILDLLADDARWASLSAAGRAYVQHRFDPGVIRDRMQRLLARVGAPPFAGVCPVDGGTGPRRFAVAGMPDSLAPGPEGPWSSERVLAAALLERAGGGAALTALAPGALPAVATTGRLPALGAALDRLGARAAPETAEIHAARLAADAAAPAALDAILADTAATNLLLALTAPDGETIPPAAIAPLVDHLNAQGWHTRTTRTPLPETALTKTILIEARR